MPVFVSIIVFLFPERGKGGPCVGDIKRGKLRWGEGLTWNALLLGAKIVTSFNESTVVTRLVFVNAPARAVRSESTALELADRGTVRTVSITCTTPPLNITSAVVTVLFSFNPEKTSTLFPDSMPITTCPPVTFVNEVLVRSVGMNCAVVVKADAGTEPFRTWYCRRAVTIEGSAASALPAAVERILLKASLEGARIVIPWAEDRAATSAGCVARRPGVVRFIFLGEGREYCLVWRASCCLLLVLRRGTLCFVLSRGWRALSLR